MGALSGALSGAGAGAALGPVGAGVGALLGGILGAFGANRAKKNLSTGYHDAMQGVLGATGAAQYDIQAANANYAPFLGAGNQGLAGLESYAGSNPRFTFNPEQYFNSPGYQFQLKEGQNAITNQASAMGLGASGNTLRDLTTFGQGLASTYYNNAFNQAQQQFQTNQNATLQNLGALINAGEFGTSGLLAGNEALGQTGIQGATLAGNYRVGQGAAEAGGNQAIYNNVASGVLGGLGGFAQIPGLFGGASGNQGAIDPGSGLPIGMIP